MSKMEDLTILYYSSNRENQGFEQRVIDNLLKVSDLPIISVTQKPMKLGKNICVGDVGVSGFNMFRQVQIGLKEVKTKFVISAESDCLYPPDYFQFVPEHDDRCYRDTNLYVMPDQRPYFFLKEEGATHAQIIGRDYYLSVLNNLFMGAPDWSTEEMNFPKERWRKEDIFNYIEPFKTENPVVQIKTHRGMRYYTHSDRTPIHELKYWGNGIKFRSKYYHGN